jgi:hypothetical protein
MNFVQVDKFIETYLGFKRVCAHCVWMSYVGNFTTFDSVRSETVYSCKFYRPSTLLVVKYSNKNKETRNCMECKYFQKERRAGKFFLDLLPFIKENIQVVTIKL